MLARGQGLWKDCRPQKHQTPSEGLLPATRQISLVSRLFWRFHHYMSPTRINTTGIPEDVLLLITVAVIAVAILCAALVGVVHYLDRLKERRSRK